MSPILSTPYELGDSNIYRNFSSNCKGDSWCGAYLTWLSSVLRIPVTNDYITTI